MLEAVVGDEVKGVAGPRGETLADGRMGWRVNFRPRNSDCSGERGEEKAAEASIGM